MAWGCPNTQTRSSSISMKLDSSQEGEVGLSLPKKAKGFKSVERKECPWFDYLLYPLMTLWLWGRLAMQFLDC